MIEQTDGSQRMLVDQKIEYLPIDNFTPAPDKIMRELINIPDSTAQLAIIHGSYVYKGN